MIFLDGSIAQILKFQSELEASASLSYKIKLKLNSIQGLSLHIGTTAITLKDDLVINLKAGQQTLTFIISHKARGKIGLHTEFVPIPNSPAALQIIVLKQ